MNEASLDGKEDECGVRNVKDEMPGRHTSGDAW